VRAARLATDEYLRTAVSTDPRGLPRRHAVARDDEALLEAQGVPARGTTPPVAIRWAI
jgi:hypothetical protein